MTLFRRLFLPVLLLLGLAAPAFAAIARVCDLGSLAFVAKDVVEGQVVRSDHVGYEQLTDVKLTAVYTGNLQVGQIITVATSGYEKNLFHDPSWANGDDLVLFLSGEASKNYLREMHVPDDRHVWGCCSSGIRYLAADTVYGVEQIANPGPYGFSLEMDTATPQAPAKWRVALQTSIAQAALLRQKLIGEPKPGDIPWLVAFLKNRAAIDAAAKKAYPRVWWCDAAAGAAVVRLASLRDPASLFDAIAQDRSHDYLLRMGLNSPAGRDYLLASIDAPKQSQSSKLRAAELLGTFSDLYHCSATVTPADGLDEEVQDYSLEFDDGPADPTNGSYITRIAGLVASHIDDDELAVQLLRSLVGMADRRYSVFRLGDAERIIEPDFVAAAAALKKAYVPGASPRACYLIEWFCARIGRDAFANLHSTHGPIICILSPFDPAQYREPIPPGRSLVIRYEMANLPWVTDARSGLPNRVQLVLQPLTGGREYVLPTRATAPAYGPTEGRDAVAIPAALPPGDYKVFFRFLRNGKPVGESYGFEKRF
jgi:hypothetical protein